MTRIAPLAAALALLAAPPVLGQADQAKQILEMTKSNWVAVRDWDGKDLLYFTHLETYRCMLEAVEYSVNGGKLERWELAPCDTPGEMFAPIPGEYLPYTELPPGSVEKVTVQITYPDGTKAMAAFDRAEIETP